MRTVALLAVLCVHAACGAASGDVIKIDWTRERMLERTPDAQVYDAPTACTALSPGQTIDLDGPALPAARTVMVFGVTGRVVTFRDFAADATMVTIVSRAEVARLVIAARLIKPKDEKATILVPLVAAYDAACAFLGELKPAVGSGPRDNTLSHIFELPPGTTHLLVHADPRAISPALLDPATKRRDHEDATVGTLAALTGLFGVLPYVLIAGTSVERGNVALAPFGMILVLTEPEWRELGLAPKR